VKLTAASVSHDTLITSAILFDILVQVVPIFAVQKTLFLPCLLCPWDAKTLEVR
jgi:hypothetical protein